MRSHNLGACRFIGEEGVHFADSAIICANCVAMVVKVEDQVLAHYSQSYHSDIRLPTQLLLPLGDNYASDDIGITNNLLIFRNLRFGQEGNIHSIHGEHISAQINATLMSSEHVQSQQHVRPVALNDSDCTWQKEAAHLQLHRMNPTKNATRPYALGNSCKARIQQSI
ncbi:hypothetical protein PSACC_02955 [Paramicrosporidium saccamoebae]|uniref:Uncharacterized protein n=1 Tax=Paramicrosporidium saccamoebae TaxID=1246581 RepID=A0A2H9THJ2_9FUNG|nr:hypothetical protein PSACC_02955 [Paramicrosporidium saccamoebae]